MTATAATAAALLVTGCGAGSGSAGSGSSYTKAVAYAQCMRSNGEPGFPDPTSTGTFSLGQVDITSQAYQTATQACQSLLPNSAQFQLSAREEQKILTGALRHAACMRAHGLADFPDPSPNSISVHGGGISIALAGGPGDLRAELQSPQGQAAIKACMSVSPFGHPVGQAVKGPA
jgi:hypothetical protein